MAHYGVIADLHGNLEALQAALAFLDRRGVERVLCLGDVVGYNADPNACVSLLRQRGIATIAGNHDRIAVGALGLERCSSIAAHALRRTRRALDAASRAWLRDLPAHQAVEQRLLLTHGSVDDVQRYLWTYDDLRDNHRLLEREHPGTTICFFGHTHRAALYRSVGGQVVELAALGEVMLPAAPNAVYFINPGALDAARKVVGERWAELALFDSARGVLTFCRLRYDHAASERKALRGGYRLGPLARGSRWLSALPRRALAGTARRLRAVWRDR
ncbi:MAG: metallophosphoesterase family protein [Proteobacteria bacterium]|nr:metallophosphoesterase family protein [Pseudomonadota bacterium]